MVRLDVNIWSARAKLQTADLPAEVTNSMPPGEVATLGSKRLFDPDKLKIFNTLKARACVTLDKYGVRFLGGWAMHDQTLKEIARPIADIAMEFDEAKRKFADSYITGVAELAGNFPKWSGILINAVPKQHEIERKFSFSWQAFRISPQDSVADYVGNDLQNVIGSLENTVVAEIAASIATLYKESFAGRDKFTRKAMRPLQTIYEKVRGLSYIHPHLVGLEQIIKQVYDTGSMAPDAGDMCMVKGFLIACSTPGGIRAICEDYVDRNKSLSDVMDPFWAIGGGMPVPPPAPKPEPVKLVLPPDWVPPVQAAPPVPKSFLMTDLDGII
jgi:hypothetical protein